ncbi:MAG: DUF3147 family protein [Bdellovibrionales bacterium]|nr:DUF3147 family protein [Bdellovibrionales bacterium]
MLQYALRVLITAVLVVAVAEVGKRSTWAGALLASLPLTSILALSWLYWDTKSVEQVSRMSSSIFWLVGPSLIFFLVLPLLLKWGVHFWGALALASGVMAGAYLGFVKILSRWSL